MKKSIKEYTYNMGAINSAFNQGLGAVAGALAVGKKLSQEKQIAEGVKAANEEKALDLEVNTLPGQENEVRAAEANIGKFIEDNPELTAVDLEDRLALEAATGDDQLPNSLTKAKEALDIMEKERLTKVTMRDFTRRRIETLRGGKK